MSTENLQSKISSDKKEGIWKYASLYSEFIKPENRLRFSDGDTEETSIKDINKMLGTTLYFKREDKSSAGSLKGRSLAYQVSLAKQNKKNSLVISTSGNAGIAAAMYCQKAGIRLYAFISPETENEKTAEMLKYNPVIIESERSIRFSNYVSAKYGIENMRASISNSSIEGFKSIAFEIFEHLGKIDAIFTFVTSGSSFVGIGRAYKCLLESGRIKKIPRLYAVQSGNIFSVASAFDSDLKGKVEQNLRTCKNKSCFLAGRLGVKNTRRRKEILKLMELSGGSGLYVGYNEIGNSKGILEKNGIYTSPEGCASFAGVLKVVRGNTYKFDKVVCVLSGKLRSSVDNLDRANIYKVESFKDVDDIVDYWETR